MSAFGRKSKPAFVAGIVGNVPEALRRAKAAGRALWLWCEPAELSVFARPDGTALWETGEVAGLKPVSESGVAA